jgi:DhnA family fructose-bisphosphate aldolase class Ia
MTAGKRLRLRRIFTKGRAVIAGAALLADDPVQKVRLAERAGLDAVVLTPGMLDRIVEDVGALSIILRLNDGQGHRQFLGVQSALVMGAEAVLIDLTPDGETLARVSEDSRRMGLPLFVNIRDGGFSEGARLAADFGADVIVTRDLGSGAGYRQLARSTGTHCLAEVGKTTDPAGLLAKLSETMQAGAQGLILSHPSLFEGRVLAGIHALVHQGVSAEEAISLARAT